MKKPNICSFWKNLSGDIRNEHYFGVVLIRIKTEAASLLSNKDPLLRIGIEFLL